MRGKSTLASEAGGAAAGEPRPRRRYDSALRRQRAARTRDRIATEGAELVRSLPTWDWKQLTFRAVAERAGVSESTAYRHFANERELHDAVLAKLQEQAGVTYQGVALDGVADVAARVFAAMSSFAVSAWTPEADVPTLTAVDQARGQALRDAVQAVAPHWAPGQRDAVAGVLDVLWSPISFERLCVQWHMSPQQATDALGWVIRLVAGSVHDGNPPHEINQASSI
jgi:AcrR family transcriptional regulator